MKQYIISLICLISVGQLYPFTKTEEALKRTSLKLVSTTFKDASVKMLGPSTQIMFGDGMYPINSEGLKTWYSTIDNVKNLMNQYNVKKRPIWNSYFSKLETISNDLINVIKITYSSMFSSGFMRFDAAEAMKQQFNSIIERISVITQTVTKRSSKSVQEAMIKDIIYQFGAQLKTIAFSGIYGIDFAE